MHARQTQNRLLMLLLSHSNFYAEDIDAYTRQHHTRCNNPDVNNICVYAHLILLPLSLVVCLQHAPNFSVPTPISRKDPCEALTAYNSLLSGNGMLAALAPAPMVLAGDR